MSNEGTLRIVVGVDFTEAGDNALDEAIRHAMRTDGSELHPVFVIARDGKNRLDEVDDALAAARDRLRQRVIDRYGALGGAGQRSVVFHVRIGEPAQAIHQVAVDADADLIVVGSHGRRGLEKMLIGSVAETLVRTAHVPVLIARPKQLAGLPRTEAPDPADPRAELHAPRILASELLTIGKRDSHISGLL